MQRFASEQRPSLANFVWEASLAGRWAATDEVPGAWLPEAEVGAGFVSAETLLLFFSPPPPPPPTVPNASFAPC